MPGAMPGIFVYGRGLPRHCAYTVHALETQHLEPFRMKRICN